MGKVRHYYTRPMSAARSDLVNAIELAGRSARLEREFGLTQLPRLIEAGALDGTRVRAVLAFGRFEGRPKVDLQVEGSVLLTCQRCLRPCECRIDDAARLVVVADGDEQVSGGYEVATGDVERLSLVDLIEEQILLGMPLVPMHEDQAECGETALTGPGVEVVSTAEKKQRPFENLRELLDKGER
jgi:uncharacterized protein